MRLTNEQLLLLLAFVGDDGLTASDLSYRLGVTIREANWRLLRLQQRGLVRKGATRQVRAGVGAPARVWHLAVLDATPAEECKVCA
jgi:predicted ArsR family transcriptional regulator